MNQIKLAATKTDPPMGYSVIGWYSSVKRAQDWADAAIKANKIYPFWLTEKTYNEGINPGKPTYILFWKKPKNSKLCGKGFKGN
jgi:hypothetical protein